MSDDIAVSEGTDRGRSGFFQRHLSRQPFIDAILLDRMPPDERNSLRDLQVSRFFVALIGAGALYMKASTFFPPDTSFERAVLLAWAFACAIGIALFDGMTTRMILLIGAEKRLGSFDYDNRRSSPLVPVTVLVLRIIASLAIALLVFSAVATRYYAEDVAVHHRKNWEIVNADRIMAANEAFDRLIRPETAAVESLNAEVDELIEQVNASTEFEDGEIERLSELIVNLKDAASNLERERITLIERQKCELDGTLCFGASGAEGDGILYHSLGGEISEREAQLRRLQTELTAAENDRAAMNRQRDTKREASAMVRDRLADVRVALQGATVALANREAGRAGYLTERVPYASPGPAAFNSTLWQVVTADRANQIAALVLMVLVVTIDLMILLQAVGLRQSKYALAMRSRLRRAYFAQELEDDEYVEERLAQHAKKTKERTMKAHINEAISKAFANDDIPHSQAAE